MKKILSIIILLPIIFSCSIIKKKILIHNIHYAIFFSTYLDKEINQYDGFIVTKSGKGFYGTLFIDKNIVIIKSKLDYDKSKLIVPKFDQKMLNKKTRILNDGSTLLRSINHCYTDELLVYFKDSTYIYNSSCPETYQEFIYTKDRELFIKLKDSIKNYPVVSPENYGKTKSNL